MKKNMNLFWISLNPDVYIYYMLLFKVIHKSSYNFDQNKRTTRPRKFIKKICKIKASRFPKHCEHYPYKQKGNRYRTLKIHTHVQIDLFCPTKSKLSCRVSTVPLLDLSVSSSFGSIDLKVFICGLFIPLCPHQLTLHIPTNCSHDDKTNPCTFLWTYNFVVCLFVF